MTKSETQVYLYLDNVNNELNNIKNDLKNSEDNIFEYLKVLNTLWHKFQTVSEINNDLIDDIKEKIASRMPWVNNVTNVTFFFKSYLFHCYTRCV